MQLFSLANGFVIKVFHEDVFDLCDDSLTLTSIQISSNTKLVSPSRDAFFIRYFKDIFFPHVSHD